MPSRLVRVDCLWRRNLSSENGTISRVFLCFLFCFSSKPLIKLLLAGNFNTAHSECDGQFAVSS